MRLDIVSHYMIVVAAACFAFIPSLDGDFVFDDHLAIVNNPDCSEEYEAFLLSVFHFQRANILP